MIATVVPALQESPAADGLAVPSQTSPRDVRPSTQSAREVRIALLLLVFALPLKPLLNLDHVLEIGPVAVISLTKLAALAFCVCLYRYVRAARPALRIDALHVLLVGILVLAILSTLHARSTGMAWATTLRYAGYMVLYFAITHLLVDTALVRRTVWALVGSCALAAVISLRRLLLEQSSLATLPYGDANDVAFVLATTLPLGIGLVVNAYDARARTPWRALGAAVAAASMSATIAASVMLSFSRGALLGVTAAAVYEIGFNRRRARIALIACAVAAATGAVVVLINPTSVSRGLHAKQHVAWANVTNRLHAWNAAIRLTAEHPVIGIGPGNFRYYYADRWQPGMHRLSVVHNTFLEIGAELGVIALGLFVTFICVAIARLTTVVHRREPLPALAAAVRSGLIVAVVAGLFVSEQFAPPFWLLGALAYGIWQTRLHEA